MRRPRSPRWWSPARVRARPRPRPCARGVDAHDVHLAQRLGHRLGDGVHLREVEAEQVVGRGVPRQQHPVGVEPGLRLDRGDVVGRPAALLGVPGERAVVHRHHGVLVPPDAQRADRDAVGDDERRQRRGLVPGRGPAHPPQLAGAAAAGPLGEARGARVVAVGPEPRQGRLLEHRVDQPRRRSRGDGARGARRARRPGRRGSRRRAARARRARRRRARAGAAWWGARRRRSRRGRGARARRRRPPRRPPRRRRPARGRPAPPAASPSPPTGSPARR